MKRNIAIRQERSFVITFLSCRILCMQLDERSIDSSLEDRTIKNNERERRGASGKKKILLAHLIELLLLSLGGAGDPVESL